MKCILLCAGYATRLYPLTRDVPKSLLPVGNVPILERILDKILPIIELDTVYVVTNHRFIKNFQFWLRNYKQKEKIKLLDDKTDSNDNRLGSIGDIDFTVTQMKIDDDVLVIAGDNLLMFDVNDFVKFAKKQGLAIAVKDLKNKKLASQYGVVKVGADKKVVEFEEKPPEPRSSLISVGLYFFGKKHVPLVSKYIDEGHSKDAPGYYVSWLTQNYSLYAYTIKGQWYDIGDIDSYNKANALFGVTLER